MVWNFVWDFKRLSNRMVSSMMNQPTHKRSIYTLECHQFMKLSSHSNEALCSIFNRSINSEVFNRIGCVDQFRKSIWWFSSNNQKTANSASLVHTTVSVDGVYMNNTRIWNPKVCTRINNPYRTLRCTALYFDRFRMKHIFEKYASRKKHRRKKYAKSVVCLLISWIAWFV